MQPYVNTPARRSDLDRAVHSALPTLVQAGGVALDWRSPLAAPLLRGDRPFHEYRDGKVLDAINRSDLRATWAKYWPPGAEAPPGQRLAGENLCRTCGGSGELDGRDCPVCGGTGETTSVVSDGP